MELMVCDCTVPGRLQQQNRMKCDAMVNVGFETLEQQTFV